MSKTLKDFVIRFLCHFRELILGNKIHVLTDHHAVTEFFKCNNLNGKFARCELPIQEFNLSFSFIPGKVNTVADALSSNIDPISLIMDHPATLRADDFKTHQRLHAFYTSFLYYLQSGDTSNLPNFHVSEESFFLLDGLL